MTEVEGRIVGEGVGQDRTEAVLTFKVKEKVWPLLKLCASEHF